MFHIVLLQLITTGPVGNWSVRYNKHPFRCCADIGGELQAHRKIHNFIDKGILQNFSLQFDAFSTINSKPIILESEAEKKIRGQNFDLPTERSRALV